MLLTIVWLTTRDNCRFRWFADSLARELNSLGPSKPEVQVIAIDSRLWYLDEQARRSEFLDCAAGRFSLEHLPPKPSVWQGPTRLTSFDFFCAASARNTALCLAHGEHVCFADDLSVLLPGWASAHLHAAVHKYVMCGSTCKNKRMVVEDGVLQDYEIFPPGQDHRLRTAQRDGSINCDGSWLFGGTFSVPLSAAIAVNGLDELHDTIGGEDYDFGIRLERAGTKICYNRTCATMESEEDHHAEAPMVRIDKPIGVSGVKDSSILLYRRLMSTTSTWTQSNRYVLRELRDQVLRGELFPVPTEPVRHWVDEQPLSKIKPTYDGYDDLERSGVRDW